MLEQAEYALGPVDAARELIRANGWALLVSGNGDAAPMVSHLPVLLDPDADPDADDAAGQATVLGHLPARDAEAHRLGERPVVLVAQGPHGYVSPSWYRAGPYVPTWNYTAVHLHGTPELLDAAGTYRVLELTTEHFEGARPTPWPLESVDAYARAIAPHAVGFRLRPTRVVAKGKLSQDKPPEVIERVIAALRADPTHANPPLAETMRERFPLR
ncbi:MAG: FMN-binding negative transcriptional regulator [Actinomycetia bacterium]|nr:FMN-binding negative transcriptional regulator [Actinomycetes bacterium]